MPRMSFVDSLACVGLFLQYILPGLLSQELTMLEHSFEGFPLLGIIMCMLHAYCYLSVFLACVYLWGARVGLYLYVYLCGLRTFVCVMPQPVCVLRCVYACFEPSKKYLKPYAAKAR